MLKRFKRFAGNSGGFTLLELIVVITIMGFLAAILAPRLARVSDAGVDMQCDQNKHRLTSILGQFVQQNNRLPDKLVSLAVGDPFSAEISSDNNNPVDGPEFLSAPFQEHNNLGAYTLTDEDVKALKEMGVSRIVYYTDTGSSDPEQRWKVQGPVPLQVGMKLAMVGLNDDENGVPQGLATEQLYSDPGLIGRLLVGVGSDCELVEKGLITNPGIYADSQRKTEYYKYGYYTIILPRLASATKDTFLQSINDANADGIVTAFFDADDDGVQDADEREQDFVINEQQDVWDFYVMCPEGHKFHLSIDGEHAWVLKSL